VRSFLIDKLKKKYFIGLVSGSDISKINEQMGGPECKNTISRVLCVFIIEFEFSFISVTAQFDYVFVENGLVAFKDGTEFKRQVTIC